MLIRLTEVYGNGVIASNPTYTLREVFVNPEHVVMIREEVKMQQLHEQGRLPKELNPNHYLPYDIPGLEILIFDNFSK